MTANDVFRRAEPGESGATELYSPFTTSSSSLIEWGVGVDLYFSSVFMLSMVMLVAGLMHLPNILFYKSEAYSPNGKDGISFTLATSAVCTTGRVRDISFRHPKILRTVVHFGCTDFLI
jgi:hypothetical protein